MDRFEVVNRNILRDEHNTSIGDATVLRDKQTGVLYLWCKEFSLGFHAGVGGLTVMLDQDGKPVTMNYSVNI